MKVLLQKFIARALILVVALFLVNTNIWAQNKARLSVDYCKVMNQNSFLKIDVKFKGDDGYEPGTMLALNVYKEIMEDSLVLVGTTTTNMNGDAKFVIELNNAKSDSLVKQNYVVKIEDNDDFKDADKSVSFIDANLTAKTIIKDSVHHITALLIDALGNPIEGEKLEVKVKRLFAPLTVGESNYKTNDDGTILVPFEEPLPGMDGNLTFEVKMDSRKYGIITCTFEAPIGIPIVDQSTFDDRTMWSPPNKTPLFLWIFPNLIILGIWIVIFMLVGNLFKIYKSH